jgi:hypothetical protein
VDPVPDPLLFFSGSAGNLFRILYDEQCAKKAIILSVNALSSGSLGINSKNQRISPKKEGDLPTVAVKFVSLY